MAREPKLGVACGKKGVGKSYTTGKMIDDYVRGNPSQNIIGRKVLVFDVNDEYMGLKPISPQHVMAFSAHPLVEARRIRPLKPDGSQMGLNELAEVLFQILQNYRGGMLLVEDINKYISDSLPNDVIGAICTNRHIDLDIIMHFQSIGRITPKIWQNLNWIRFHKNSDSVEKHASKLDDKYEICKITEYMVNEQYSKGNERYYLFIDLDEEKIYGNYTRKMFSDAMLNIIAENPNRTIKPLIIKKSNFDTKKSKEHTQQAIKEYTEQKIRQYTNI